MSDEKTVTKSLFLAECLGTFILIFFGCGAVHAAVCFDAQSGLWQVAIVWGLAIMLAIYVVGGISGAHINPAITITLAIWDDFPVQRIWVYLAGQFTGAILAAATLFTLFSPTLKTIEDQRGVVRGEPGSEITASCYGEYFPNPGGLKSETYSADEHASFRETVPHSVAFLAELLGTAILAVVVLAVGDERNKQRPPSGLAAVFIGLTVSALISVIAPLTQACFNPARDFGPRLFAYFAGWGEIALPLGGDMSWLTVYIIAPILGAVLGGGFYKKVLSTAYNTDASETEDA